MPVILDDSELVRIKERYEKAEAEAKAKKKKGKGKIVSAAEKAAGIHDEKK